jgi:hypothetical protein
MNPHLRRGFIAFAIAFGVVLIYGVVDIYFDPPVDVLSVGYSGYGILVKSVLAIGIGLGLTILFIVTTGSWLIVSAGKTWVRIGLVVVMLLIGGAIYLLSHPFEKDSAMRSDDYSKGKVECCKPHN